MYQFSKFGFFLVALAWVTSACTLLVDFDQKASLCGNGNLDPNEICDDKMDTDFLCNDGSHARCVNCRWQCNEAGYCGDGHVDEQEDCEAGVDSMPSACLDGSTPFCENCHWVCPTCGNGELDTDLGEICEYTLGAPTSGCRETTGEYFGTPECNHACMWEGCYAGLLRGGIQNDGAADLVADAEGNFYVLGTTGGNFPDANSTATLGGMDMVLMKITPQGNIAWTKLLGTPQNDKAVALAIDLQNNMLYVLGETNANNGDIVLVKLTLQAGEIKIQKSYGGSIENRQGTSESSADQASDIVVDGGGFVYVSGSTNASKFMGNDLTMTGQHALLLKINPDDGNVNQIRSHVSGTGRSLINLSESLYWTYTEEFGIVGPKVRLEKLDHDLSEMAQFNDDNLNLSMTIGNVVIDGAITPSNTLELYLGITYMENGLPVKITVAKIGDMQNNFELINSRTWGQSGIFAHQIAFFSPTRQLRILGTTNQAITNYEMGKLDGQDAFLAELNSDNLDIASVRYFGSYNNDKGAGLHLLAEGGLPCMVGTFSGEPDPGLNFLNAYSSLDDIAIWCDKEELVSPMK